MDIIRLEKEQLHYFKDMDPFALGDRLELNNYFAVGALVHNNTKNVDIPMGLMICSLIEQGLVIEWICVGERFRSYGIGEKLLITAFDLAAELGTGKIFAYINEYTETFTRSQLAYLKDRLFEEEYPVLGEWITTLSDIKAGPTPSANDNVNAILFDKLPESGRNKALEEFAKLSNTIFIYPFELEDDCFDSKHSFLLFDGEKISGGLFTKKVKETIYITAISIKSIEEGEELIIAFTNSYSEVDKDTPIRLQIRQKPMAYDWYDEPEDLVDYDTLKAFAKKVFTKFHHEGRYLAASIYTYIEHFGETVELDVWNDLAYEALEEAQN